MWRSQLGTMPAPLSPEFRGRSCDARGRHRARVQGGIPDGLARPRARKPADPDASSRYRRLEISIEEAAPQRGAAHEATRLSTPRESGQRCGTSPLAHFHRYGSVLDPQGSVAGGRQGEPLTTTKPKLLFVGAFPPEGRALFGGNVTACRTLLDAGLADYFDLILFDSTQRSVPPPPPWRRAITSLSRCWRFVRLVRRHRPNVVLIFSSAGSSFTEKSTLSALARLYGSRVLLFPRGGRLMDDCRRSQVVRWLTRRMLAVPDVVLCQGEAWRDFFVEEIGVPARKCAIVRNWTATPSLIEIGAVRTYGRSTEASVPILFLGCLFRSKGIFDLLQAIAILHSRHPRVVLLVAGEGEAGPEARQFVASHGLGECVQFLGWVDSDRKLRALADAAIFCLPSYVEGFPNALIEAMATGLPVVTTPVGSIPDTVQHGINGLLTPSGDVEALTSQLELLIASSSLREQLGRSAHAYAAREFTADRAISELSNLVWSSTRHHSRDTTR